MKPDHRFKIGWNTVNSVPDGTHLSQSECEALQRRYLEEVGPHSGSGMIAYMGWAYANIKYLDHYLSEKGVTVEPPPKSSAYPAKDYKAWG